MTRRIQCNNYNVFFNDWSSFQRLTHDTKISSIFVIVDENTEKFCLHKIYEHLERPFFVIRIPSGEIAKSLETCQMVWSQLVAKGADRRSLLINLGGGVIGDLGGFCASTYMRGIRFVQVPTTLLSQVDASVGGKVGIDFQGYKNLIGSFSDPEEVFIFSEFLHSLPTSQLLSGYAELLKHGLIADKEAWENLSDQKDIKNLPYESLVYDSVLIKKQVTDLDPKEQGLRKILNFGHTVGHAVESYWLHSNKPLLHGEAIAMGMVSESYLSYRFNKISESELFQIRKRILSFYGHKPKYMMPSSELIDIMSHDKKAVDGKIQFALLEQVGAAAYDFEVDKNMIEDSLIFYREKL